MSRQNGGEVARAGAVMAQDTAFELFQIAALLLGNEQEAVSVVEEAVANMESDPCANTLTAHDEIRSRLVQTAVRQMTRLHPGAFAAPMDSEGQSTCIDTDDVNAAGMTGEQLSALIQGPGRAEMREWLDQLAPALRAVFVLRAVVGQDGERTAEGLRQSGAMGAELWTRENVGSAYRQALCSLATSLVSSNWVAVPS